MGKETRNFRQSAKSRSGNDGARQYAQINRAAWHERLIDYIRVRGKSLPADRQGNKNGQG